MMNNETATEIRITNEWLRQRKAQATIGSSSVSTYHGGQQLGKNIYYVDDDGQKVQITSMKNEMSMEGQFSTTFTDMDGKAFEPTF